MAFASPVPLQVGENINLKLTLSGTGGRGKNKQRGVTGLMTRGVQGWSSSRFPQCGRQSDRSTDPNSSPRHCGATQRLQLEMC